MDKTIILGLVIGISAVVAMTTAATTATVQAQATGCPHPGQCSCDTRTGVMTDNAMPPPFNRINNGCMSDS